MDVYTKRPRTPNDQYTVLTDEQVKNIQKVQLRKNVVWMLHFCICKLIE